MALIRTGGGISDISGSIGGTTFARNRGGAYARQRVKPLNPRSNDQANTRNRFGINSTGWRNLTEAARLSWVGWAATHPVLNRLGEAVILSGAQAYSQVNNNRTFCGDPATASVVPGDPAFVANIIDSYENLTVDVSSALVTVPLGDGALEGQIISVFATPLMSPGIANVQKYLRSIGVVTIDAAAITAGSIEFGSNWEGKFGSMAGGLGRQITASIQQYDEGQYAVPVQLSGIAVA